MIHLARFVIAFLMSTIMYAQDAGSSIEVEIIGIDNSDGQMLIGLYDSEDSWLEKRVQGTFGKIIDGKSTATFENIPDGSYAISVFHDENNDGKLETNFLGIPSEDTGSSNDAPARFGPPKWEDAKFEVKGSSIKQIINL